VEIAIEQSQTPLLILTVRDRDGNYVSDLEGIVKAFRPQLTAAVAEMPLTADPEAPGVYRQPLRQAQPGLWDFELTAHRDSNRYYALIRKEL
jgi:nitrogen fixation protein FixH